jgi:flagellar biosynthetic protein FliP
VARSTPQLNSEPQAIIRGRLSRLAPLALAATLLSGCSGASSGLPSVNVQVGSGQGDSLTLGVQLLLLLTVLSIAPAVLIMVTSFIRIAIVLSFTRSAIGMTQMPPNQVLIGLALFLTVFVMTPVWTLMHGAAVQPYLDGAISLEEAMDVGAKPLREFMLKQTREKDLALFFSLGRVPVPQTADETPIHVLIPAFMISELKTAFQMGFVILLPFLVIDMVVSSTLMSMGMMMLPPTTISLPFKVLLFVMADGWHLIVKSLVTSFF